MDEYNGTERRTPSAICSEKFKHLEEDMKEIVPLIRETREVVFNGLPSRMKRIEMLLWAFVSGVGFIVVRELIKGALE